MFPPSYPPDATNALKIAYLFGTSLVLQQRTPDDGAGAREREEIQTKKGGNANETRRDGRTPLQ
jgi:hypothetical protein